MEKMNHPINDYLLTCPIKSGFGVECPGCGFQRSFISLIQGDFATSWMHYPALIPFLLTIVCMIIAIKTKIRFRYHILAGSLVTTCCVIAVHYIEKFI